MNGSTDKMFTLRWVPNIGENRAKIVNILILSSEVMAKHPQLRMGQLIVCAAKMGGWKDDDVFYCPDDVLLDGLKKMLGEKRKEMKQE